MAGVLYPRCYLSISGNMIPCESIKVTKKAKRSADTFTAELAIAETAQYGMDVTAWANYQPSPVQVMASSQPDQSDLTSLITGNIDEPKINWEKMTVSVQGRDLSASLIETRRSQKFPNQKSSDIASTIAQANGLNPVVTDTSDYAGKQYKDNDVNHLALHRTDWEIMGDLADREGYRWYVEGMDLHFEPKDQGGSSAYQAQFQPPSAGQIASGNIWDLETSRNMTAAKTHNVNVKTWHAKDKKAYVGQAQAQGVGGTINIDHHHSGKTKDQADKVAVSRAQDAIRHDCSISFSAPLDLTVDPKQQQIQLSGTGTIYDQLYDMDEVTFDIEWGGGHIEVKGKSANGRTAQQGGSNSGADSAANDPGDIGGGGGNSGGSSQQPSSVPTPPPRPPGIGGAAPPTAPIGT